MYTFLDFIISKVTASTIIGFLAVTVVISVVVGFFTKQITSDVFMTIVGSVLTYFFKELQAQDLKTQIIDKDNHIKQLTTKIENNG